MDERLKELRGYLGMSQEEFGKRINLSKPTISAFETQTRNMSDRVISDICSVFNVNEDWLRSGQGNMFVETKGSFISSIAKQYNLDELDQVIVESYLALNSEQRSGIKDFFHYISKALENEETAAAINIDEELAKYRLELEAELKGEEKSSVLPSIEGRREAN